MPFTPPLQPIIARPGTWAHGNQQRPCIRLYRLVHRRPAFVVAVDYQQARRLADQLHDACDAYQQGLRKQQTKT